MKNKLLTAALLSVVATAATATSSSVTTTSTTGTLPSLCEFSNVTNGSMDWNETTNVFDITTPAEFTMKVRDVTSVSVTNNGELYDVDANAVADNLSGLNYSGSSATPQDNLRSLSTTGTSTFTINNFDAPQYFDVSVTHSTTPSSTFVAKSSTNYRVSHTITCTF